MLRRRLNSFKFAFAGFLDLIKTQANAKFHIFAAVLVIGGGFFFSISLTEWCLSIFAIVLVISAEAFNTALEYLTDLVSPEYHPIAGKTKDVAAAAVLICAAGALLVGFLIFLPKVCDFFSL